VSTLALMCDPRDLGIALDDRVASVLSPPRDVETNRFVSPDVDRWFCPTLFVYEHVPGGTGLAERIWEQRDVLLGRTLRLLETCPCEGGCPACVGPGEASRKDVAIDLLRRVAPQQGAPAVPVGCD
jgi:DEAD/DEAH box helicase domain-containing protein